MRALFVLAILALNVLADKETYPEDLSDNLLSPVFWRAIQKRLKDYGYDEFDDLDLDLDESLCSSHEVTNNTIIRTRDSQAAGAIYIDSPAVTSREACLAECCAVEKCNIAVFKEKRNNHTCYLFDCGTPNVCLFTSHPGYSIIKLPSRTTGDKSQLKHEKELTNLVTESTTTTTTVQPTTPPKPREPGPLFSKCDSDTECAAASSECVEGYCLCKEEYHEQEGVCRENCNKFEFECHNVGQPLMAPQCVAIYHKCDGLKLCQDNSDEENCDSGFRGVLPLHSRWRQGKGPHRSSNYDWIEKNSGGASEKPNNNDDELNNRVRRPPPHVAKSDKDDDKDTVKSTDSSDFKASHTLLQGGGTDGQTSDSSSDADKEVAVSETSSVDLSSSQEQDDDLSHVSETETDNTGDNNGDSRNVQSAEDDKDGESNNEPDGTEEHPQEENKDNESMANVLSNNSEIIDVENTGVTDDDDDSDQDDDDDSGLVTAQRVTDTFSHFYQSNRGAVVALALGLSITALLLIFVGCRLRNVKRRLRKGRPLNSNEADYLINGMYL